MAATSQPKAGIAGRRYRNTGTYGSPTWTAQTLDLDVTASMPWDYVEAGARTSRAKLYMKARADLAVQIKARADDADAGAVAIMAAAMSPTSVLDCLILNGLITVEGCQGFRAEWLVSLNSEGQEADGSIYDVYDLKPTWSTNAAGPSTVVMGASSVPTFTAL